MAVKTSTLIERIDFVTSDYRRAHFQLADISLFLNEAQSLIAEAVARAATRQLPFTLQPGMHQDLRTDTTVPWIQLLQVVCRANASGLPTGRDIRAVDGVVLARVAPNYRSTPPGPPVEYAFNPLRPLEFDVMPPAAGGEKVVVQATVRPGPICVLNPAKTALQDPNEVIGLADGFDAPMVDWALFRLFTKDAADQAYAARAASHQQACKDALGVVLKAPE